MQENNMNILDITPVLNEKISADKIYNLQENIHCLEGQLSIASALVDEKDAQLKKQKEEIKSLKKQITELKDKLLDAQEGIIRFYQAM